MKKIFFLLGLFLLLPKIVFGIEPISVNNKFGVHLAVPTDADLEKASEMVNSNNGKWGYVTLVIPQNDMDINKWQGVFDKMRSLHLIPIIRLASLSEGENWLVPKSEDSQIWLEFLNSLNWVIKNRYIILFNEPNHAKEWGGKTNPEEYAKIALQFAKKLKQSNPDYFVMLAGLDQAAPQLAPEFMAGPTYLRTVIEEIGIKDFAKYFDGLSSHSYPNPGFSGSPSTFGWGSIRGYESELSLLKELGLEKGFPVFITETGWVRQNLGENMVADYFVYAFNNVWQPDSRVKAVTPFILNYQSEPFLDFSFQKQNSSEFYPQFSALLNLTKISGQPVQIEKAVFLNEMPKKLVQDSSFQFELQLLNLGQSIWDKKDDYQLKLISQKEYYYRFSELSEVVPNSETTIKMEFHTPEKLGKSRVKIGLFLRDKLVQSSKEFEIDIVPLANLIVNYRLFSFNNSGTDFQVELYDKYENLVYIKRNIEGKKGEITLRKVRNVALNEKYRVVLLKPGYLPRQNFVVFGEIQNKVKIRIMWGLDFNKDGKLTFADFNLFED